VYDTGGIKRVCGQDQTEAKTDIKTVLDSIESLKLDIQSLERKMCVLNSKVTDLRGEGGMQIFLKDLKGKTLTLELHPSYTVKTVKYIIWERQGVLPSMYF
jgi:hypothetical protein